MSGHSKWAQIKRKKEATDEKRGKIFSKLLRTISLAAKSNPNPEGNAELRRAIDEARRANVPKENIERALQRAGEAKALEEVVIEAYGPEGTALAIRCETDNKNRTIQEVKVILRDHNGKWADPGSVTWAFDPSNWSAKFPVTVSEHAAEQLQELSDALLEHEDVVEVHTNVSGDDTE